MANTKRRRQKENCTNSNTESMVSNTGNKGNNDNESNSSTSKKQRRTKTEKKDVNTRKSMGKKKSFTYSIDTCDTIIAKMHDKEAHTLSREKHKPTNLDNNDIKHKIDIVQVEEFFNHHGERLKNAKNKGDVSKIINDVLDPKNGIVWFKKSCERVTTFDPSPHISDKGTVSWECKIQGNKWLEVKKSNFIQNSKYPFGLFAGKAFSKGDVIGIYLGEYNRRQSRRKNMKRASLQSDDIYQLHHIDAKCSMFGRCFMAMHLCNDPRLLIDFQNNKSRGKPAEYNVEFTTNLTMIAKKNIRGGTELKIDYNLLKK